MSFFPHSNVKRVTDFGFPWNTWKLEEQAFFSPVLFFLTTVSIENKVFVGLYTMGATKQANHARSFFFFVIQKLQKKYVRKSNKIRIFSFFILLFNDH